MNRTTRMLGAVRFAMAGLAAVAVWAGPESAQASLIGDDVQLQVFAGFPSPFYDQTAIGDISAVEFANVGGGANPNDVDILDEDTIQISLRIEGTPGSKFGARDFIFSDVDWGGSGTVLGLENFVLTGLTSFTGFELLSATSFRINGVDMQADLSSPLATLTFDVVGAHSEVPEPASLMLLGGALVGMGIRRRRR